MPGDVVRRMKGDSQRGYCREIFVRADVKVVGTRYVVKNVSSERLKPLITMPRDNAVCLDNWVGSTKNINEKLTLRSSCGSILEVRPDIEYCPLKDADTKSRSGFFATTGTYYPGQTLIGPVSELENAKWITTSSEMRTSRKHKTVDRKFVVQSVEIEGVWVNWQCKASCEESVIDADKDGDNGILQPKCYVTGDDLKRMKRLNLFESCMLQINDKNYLKIEADDQIVGKSQWKKEQNSMYRVMRDLQRQHQHQKPTTEPTVTVNAPMCAPNSAPVSECDKSKLCPNNVIKERSNETGSLSREALAKHNSKINKGNDSDEWQTDDDNDENGSMSDSNTTVSTCSSSATPKSSPRKSPLLANKIQKLKKRHSPSNGIDKPPTEGTEVVTETLVVYSMATIVWQDGTIETDIPSIELQPIHHLDDHEFFPGDFVLAGDGQSNTSYRDYGVIQKVHHLGRTAKVKWFSTYTCNEEPRPTYKGESEVSVYDLKDHPDFQYRPGTIVLRIANFGDEKQCTAAGQVMDNFCDGYVKVWWVDGHVSNCWPQDLFEVGQYDADNNFWTNDDSDNDSWETEDETSELGGQASKEVTKPQLVHNLERARVAMSQLEEIFVINPGLQNQNVMRKLLVVYKKCRYLDRLMGTSFFHEEHFQGLVERVRKGGNPSTAERVKDQKIRLFNESPIPSPAAAELAVTFIKKLKLADTRSSDNKNSHSHESNSHEETSCSSFCSCKSTSTFNTASTNSTSPKLLNPTESKQFNKSTSSDISSLDDNEVSPKTKEDDSGHYSKSESGIPTITTVAAGYSTTDCVCARLCALIKAQLVKALQEINSRYCQTDDFKEMIIEEYEIIDVDEKNEPNLTIVDTVTSTSETLPEGDESVEENTVPSTPSTSTINSVPGPPSDAFQILESAPSTHKYHLTVFHPTNAHNFYKAVQKEHRLLRTGLPAGVWVKTFEDRLDLLSVLIEGPKMTPYEDGIFIFDIQLGPDYPKTPPLCHYISYCSDRLNPNLYEDGKVCVSLLGTWSGRGTEVWNSTTSTLLQVIVSIQGLILVDEPYFNEAGYEKQKGMSKTLIVTLIEFCFGGIVTGFVRII